MLYLRKFSMLSREQEEDYLSDPGNRRLRRSCYSTKYPFGVFRYRELPTLEFAPLTVLYGGNGSGKSTLLHVMAEKLRLQRGAVLNSSPFFEDYVSLCRYEVSRVGIPEGSRFICSDDVFDWLLDTRCLNEGIDRARLELFDRYIRDRKESYQLKSLEDYEEFRRRSYAKSRTQSRYVKEYLAENLPERSNGESALQYFTESIRENALYLLDEPENSLSAALQLELKQFLEDSVRFFGCQFIIATHAPLLLSMQDAKIYDLDAKPPTVRKWTELENVQVYQRFFARHAEEFS